MKKDLKHYPSRDLCDPRLTHQQRTSYTRSLLCLTIILLVFDIVRPFAQTSTRKWLPLRSVTSSENTKISVHSDVDWDKLPTLRHLVYTPCYTNLTCARLSLLLDHFNNTTNATISLAIIRKPAVVPVTSPYYGGAIILNPGGPGGSGVEFVESRGDALRVLVDSPREVQGAKFYDLISFDPRGVRLSTPRVHCFQTNQAYSLWHARMNEEGSLYESDAAFDRLWAMSYAEGHSCELFSSEFDIKHYVSTAYVAADMLRLIEAHGAWRHEEARRLLAASVGRGAVIGRHMETEIPPHLQYVPGKEKIQYWGSSYGTILGLTFASLYPDRIARFVLDGVDDAEDYSQVRGYANLVDTEKAMAAFYINCARVGPAGCALAEEEGVSAVNISKRVDRIVKRLRKQPLPVVAPDADVLTHHNLRLQIALALFAPIKMFPRLAETLAGAERGLDRGWLEGSELPGALSMSSTATDRGQRRRQEGRRWLRSTSDNQDNYDPNTSDNFLSAHNAIMCTDGPSLLNLTRSSFLSHVAHLQQLSPTLGALWSESRLACRGWAGRARYRFTGPWSGNTSHPILFIGNTADPVTPISAAHKMAKGFPGSVVLTVDGPGHCASAVPSLCWVERVRAYLREGTLPEVGTVCKAEIVPFGPGLEEIRSAEAADQDAKMVLRAVDEVAMGLRGVRGRLGGAWLS